MKPYSEKYEKDGITLYLGDCRDILPTLQVGTVDLVLTDPPYGVSLPGVSHDGQPGSGSRNFDFFPNDTAAESGELALQVIAETERLLAPHGSGYAWVSHRQFASLTPALEVKGWTTRFLVWEKSCPPPPPPGSGWPSAAELCIYWFRPGRRWTHDGKNFPRSNVLEVDAYRYGKPGKVAHPTQKPFGVINPLILASSLPGDLILDPFSGSGTTLRAAKDLGRRAIGCEVNPEFYEIACGRLAQKVLALAE